MLLIPLDFEKKSPLYEQIYMAVREEIRTGALPFGAKLPSARRLARHLEVSRNTVDTAYSQLAAEGYVKAEPKRGFFVCPMEELADLNIPLEVLQEEAEPEIATIPYDFSPSGADMSQFPYHIWRKLLKDIMIDDNSELFQKGHFQGDFELRRAIMYYLRQSRGVHVTAGQIVVGAGMENLLFLLRQIFGRKKTVGIENPVYIHAHEMLRELGFEICPIPMDSSGLLVEELEQSQAELAYVTPAHQYPTGVVMPIGRRSQLIRWAAQEKERYILEDDYDSEFRYAGKPIPALQGIAESEKIIYMGTFSRAIAPAIRVSYMVLPQKLMPAYQKVGKAFSCAVSRIDQRVLTLFLTEGHFERHLNRMRNIYKEKHDLLLSCLHKMGDQVKVSGQGAGVHVIAEFPVKNCRKFEQDLQKRGVRIYPLSRYWIEKCPKREQYILGFTRMTKEDMIKGTGIIREVLCLTT